MPSGSERAVLYGESEGGALAAFFAATHPERVSALVLYGSHARYAWAPDYPMGHDAGGSSWSTERSIARDWGTIEAARDVGRCAKHHRLANDEAYRPMERQVHPLRRFSRRSAGIQRDPIRNRHPFDPGKRAGPDARDARRAAGDRERRRSAGFPVPRGSDPGAKYVELPGNEYWPRAREHATSSWTPIEGFVHSIRAEQASIDRVLATVLFTDIVGSTRGRRRSATPSGRCCSSVTTRSVRAMIGRYRGTEIDTTGDGFLATFDGPARGVKLRAGDRRRRCDRSGLEIRAGLHTGEVEIDRREDRGSRRRISARASAPSRRPSEVLVSQTVKDLVAGSGLAFEDAGEHELKGVPDRWHLYRVVA